ncbi:unnamed protein product [Paramecium primaurelia]|uniref:Potassium channel domain-containing protein n=1 Tax=Paramecium primaurelia TaxID=5886 RepID=A0A8S1N1F6_PARPR|nr:unnamed protein product [Paramecium primaurelia]
MQFESPRFNVELDQELQAEQNEDFEQQYLGFCLRSTKRETSINYPHLYSQTQSIKSIEGYDQYNVKKLEQLALRNVQKSPPETSKTIINVPSYKQHSTGSSMMAFFLLKRFLEKLQIKRRMLETLNYTHLNLIGDKAADSNILLQYSKSIQRAGFTLQAMKKLFEMESQIEETKMENLKQYYQNIKKQIIKICQTTINLIPLIQPESLFKIYWDLFAVVFRIILVILIPLEVAFHTQMLFQDNTALTVIICIVLIMDFFIRINTQQYLNGQAIRDRWKLIIFQVKKSIFIDFLSITILLIFLSLIPENPHYNLFTLVTLTQYSYVYEILSKSEQYSYFTRPQRGILGLLKFMATLYYILHLFSCFWFWISSLQIEDSWIDFKDLTDKPWQLQYLEALYFAIVTMLTIGYGDNVPKNSTEKIVTIIFILGACLWFSYSINFIGGIINDITQNQVERNQKMRVINKYMNKRNIPFALQHQIKEYLTYRWKEDDEVDLEIEQTLLDQLSDELKEELDRQAHKVFIEKSILLQQFFSEEFRNALFKSIKRKIIPPENTFYIDFNGQHHLCFIEQGHLLYQHKDEKQRSKMNTIIGLGEFLCVKEFIVEDPDMELFKAVGYVSLLVLSKQDFLTTLKDYPDDFQKYCQLKDSIVLNIDQTVLQKSVYCPACQQFEHSLSKCPYIQHKPNFEVIIKKHQHPKIQQRSSFQRRRKKNVFLALSEKDLVAEFAKVYSSDNQQSINQQLKITYYHEQDQIDCNIIDPTTSVDIFRVSSLLPQYSTEAQNKQIDLLSSVRMESKQIKEPEIDIKGELRQQLNQGRLIRKMTMFPSNNTKQIKKSPTNTFTIKQVQDEDWDESLQIQTFQNTHNDNIIHVYNKLNKQDIEDPIIKKAISQIEPLFWRLNQKMIEDFEVIQNYDFFYSQFNAEKIIDQANKNIHHWQKDIIEKMQKFMLFPFNYILKYLKLRRNRMNQAIIEKGNKFKRVKNKLRMMQLRSNLQQKKISTTSNKVIRFGQVLPSKVLSRDSIII